MFDVFEGLCAQVSHPLGLFYTFSHWYQIPVILVLAEQAVLKFGHFMSELGLCFDQRLVEELFLAVESLRSLTKVTQSQVYDLCFFLIQVELLLQTVNLFLQLILHRDIDLWQWLQLLLNVSYIFITLLLLVKLLVAIVAKLLLQSLVVFVDALQLRLLVPVSFVRVINLAL